jgi:glutamine amidotransferase
MCRMMGYVGTPVRLDTLLHTPDSSLLRQTVGPRMLDLPNLAGFGLMAWSEDGEDSGEPWQYHTPDLPLFDRNLRNLARKVRAHAFLAHIRGVPLHGEARVHEANLHPFRYPGARLALAHNGDLAGFDLLRYQLLPHIRPAIARHIAGNTDSEWIYALLLSQLADPAAATDGEVILRAVEHTLRVIRQVRDAHGVTRASSVNLVISDGVELVATRFCFDFGRWEGEVPPPQGGRQYLSQWYTVGQEYGLHEGEWKLVGGAARADSVLVASEPLTRDHHTWVEVPEYSALRVKACAGGRRKVELVALDV